MEQDTNFKLVGHVNASPNADLNPQDIQGIMVALQRFMNEQGITKIDVALNPFEEGQDDIRQQGNIISTMN